MNLLQEEMPENHRYDQNVVGIITQDNLVVAIKYTLVS